LTRRKPRTNLKNIAINEFQNHSMKRRLSLAAVIATMVAVSPASLAGIMKCKDANGMWHYGDHAAAACTQSRSKVIEFSAESGAEKVLKAPPTKQQLQQEQAKQKAEAQEKKAEQEQAKQDKILRESYSTEQDIIFERDRKVKELQDAISSGEATVQSLQAVLQRSQQQVDEEKAKGKVSPSSRKTLERSKKQVEEHQAALADQRKQLSEMRQKYARILQRFRAMEKREASSGASQPAKTN
jgi:predicted RNase H-like nuclease (RuvC/YqgF family)